MNPSTHPDAAPPQGESIVRIGDRFLHAGLLSAEQVDATIALQGSKGLRFGEAAIELGFLTEAQLSDALSRQFNYATASATYPDLDPSLRIAHAPFGREAEEIRQIRSQVSIRLGDPAKIALAVVSPLRGEGKSYIAASLAIAFSQAGLRTLFINANLRASGQQDLFGVGHRTAAGLSTILAGHTPVNPGQVVPGFPLLFALGSGPRPPNPGEILREPSMRSLLGEFAQNFDVLIVDTPAAVGSSDAQVIARQVGACLLVARRNVTPLTALRQANDLMRTADVQTIGTVYNEFDSTRTPGTRARRLGRLLRKFSRADAEL